MTESQSVKTWHASQTRVVSKPQPQTKHFQSPNFKRERRPTFTAAFVHSTRVLCSLHTYCLQDENEGIPPKTIEKQTTELKTLKTRSIKTERQERVLVAVVLHTVFASRVLASLALTPIHLSSQPTTHNLMVHPHHDNVPHDHTQPSPRPQTASP
jgi:hypothetical protein